jgi:beta-mannanase
MFNCPYCNKEYTRKTSFSRHELLCEIIYKQKTQSKASQNREEKCEEEESPPQNISIQSLYKIIQELAFKNKHMEEELHEIKKYVSTNVNNINVINMLNSPTSPIPTPTITLEEWKRYFLVTEQDIRNLENMVETIKTLIKKNLATLPPFISFAQKKHAVYIYTASSTEENNTFHWRKQTPEEFISLFKFIHSKITQALSGWYKKNKETISRSDKMGDEYQKNLGKLMSVDFKSPTTIGKIRTHLYNSVQTDLKTTTYSF